MMEEHELHSEWQGPGGSLKGKAPQGLAECRGDVGVLGGALMA